MIVKDEKTLNLFRGKGRCELCGRPCQCREPHHWHPRGLGARMDIKENLISLGGIWECGCHVRVEAGNIDRRVLLLIIALREKSTPRRIEGRIFRVLNPRKR